MRRLAIPGRSRFAGPSAGGSRLGLLLSSTVHHHRVIGLMRRLAIPGRSRFAGPSAGGSRLGLLLSSTVHHHRVVGLMRRLAIPRRSPLAALAGPLAGWLAPLLAIPGRSRFAGPSAGGSRRYS